MAHFERSNCPIGYGVISRVYLHGQSRFGPMHIRGLRVIRPSDATSQHADLPVRSGLLGAVLALPPVHAPSPVCVMLLDGEQGGPYHAWQETTP